MRRNHFAGDEVSDDRRAGKQEVINSPSFRAGGPFGQPRWIKHSITISARDLFSRWPAARPRPRRDSVAENQNSVDQIRHYLALSGNPGYALHNGELDRWPFAMAPAIGGSGAGPCTTGDRLSQLRRKTFLFESCLIH